MKPLSGLLLFKGVEVLHQGDTHGNWMVLKLTTRGNKKLHAISVPQSWDSPTGPTWVYLVDTDCLTLIDAGGAGSFHALSQGLERAGFSIADVERVILTHGHWDHDGAAADIVAETSAKLWTHDIYPNLLPYHPRELLRSSNLAIQQAMEKMYPAEKSSRPSLPSAHPMGGREEALQVYFQARRTLEVGRQVRQGDRVDGLSFIHTPGHSPDHICILWNGILFTGDHVLPEITPHPTMKVAYPQEIRNKMPLEYNNEETHWGLLVYLKSLKRVIMLEHDTPVLPAHRLYNKDKFNFVTTSRAEEIVQHHLQRLHRIVKRIGHEPSTLEDITGSIFSRHKLVDGNLYGAFREVVSHLELLVDAGDVEQVSSDAFRWRGTENFRQLVKELKP